MDSLKKVRPPASKLAESSNCYNASGFSISDSAKNVPVTAMKNRPEVPACAVWRFFYGCDYPAFDDNIRPTWNRSLCKAKPDKKYCCAESRSLRKQSGYKHRNTLPFAITGRKMPEFLGYLNKNAVQKCSLRDILTRYRGLNCPNVSLRDSQIGQISRWALTSQLLLPNE